MPSYFKKAFACLIVTLILLSITPSSAYSYSASDKWAFSSNCYFGFNQSQSFNDAPHKGTSLDPSLVGYWSMDENAGLIAHDYSGNENNGTLINSPTWVAGEFGNAISFGSSQFINVPYCWTLDKFDSISISAWI